MEILSHHTCNNKKSQDSTPPWLYGQGVTVPGHLSNQNCVSKPLWNLMTHIILELFVKIIIDQLEFVSHGPGKVPNFRAIHEQNQWKYN